MIVWMNFLIKQVLFNNDEEDLLHPLFLGIKRVTLPKR